MKDGDLTSLRKVKMWLATTNYVQPSSPTNSIIDEVLEELITDVSSAICAELERPWILPKVYASDTYDGTDGDHQFLRNWPVLSVAQLSIGTQIIPPSPQQVGNTIQSTSPGYGYRVEEWTGIPPGGPQAIELVGTRFWRGRLNIIVDYTAGYQVASEPQAIPSPVTPPINTTITAAQPYGIWAQDNGVVYASSLTPLTFIPYVATALPSVRGTYTIIPADSPVSSTVTQLQPSGQYIFYTGAGGDAGASIQLTYGFIPAALDRLAVQLVCEQFLYRTHIGELSRSVGTQGVIAKYRDDEFPKYAKPTLQRYRSILPI
jgi:hypothetical protein